MNEQQTLSFQLSDPGKSLRAPLRRPSGRVQQSNVFQNRLLSEVLAEDYFRLLTQTPDWQETRPILLGSWARGFLCPKSDIDVLFLGHSSKVLQIKEVFEEAGLRLRYRVPEDSNDWSIGVQAKDVFALVNAKPANKHSSADSLTLQKMITELFAKPERVNNWLQELTADRLSRIQNYESAVHFLEPHLKQNSGCLRDIQFALTCVKLFPDKFGNEEHFIRVLEYYQDFFVSVRQKLHVLGYGDVLVKDVQDEIGRWCGFSGHKDFMKSLHRGIERCHFYCTWVVESSCAPKRRLRAYEGLQIEGQKWKRTIQSIKCDSSIFAQFLIRKNLDSFPKASIKERAKIIQDVLDIRHKGQAVDIFFQSRMVDKILPGFQKLVGHVQHDQYHRYTADQHIQQAVRWVYKIKKQPSRLYDLKPLVHGLTLGDWNLLVLTALFHDLGKGSGRNHEKKSIQELNNYLPNFRMNASDKKLLHLLVEHHLEMAAAAFRSNPQSPRVWQRLYEIGLSGRPARLLAIFTVIDILATHPDNWTHWKAKCLRGLYDSLNSEAFAKYSKLKQARALGLRVSKDFFSELDPVLIQSIPTSVMIADLMKAQKSKQDLQPKFFRNKNEFWIRFHHRIDRQGSLVEDLTRFFGIGIQLEHASVHTLKDIGVYNWFKVQTNLSIRTIQKRWRVIDFTSIQAPKVQFDQVLLDVLDQQHWVITFTGRDRPGMALAAAKRLTDLRLSIVQSQVHTWGLAVDDVFIVRIPRMKKGKRLSREEVLTALKENNVST